MSNPENCVKVTNPSLYCVETEDSFSVDKVQIHDEQPKEKTVNQETNKQDETNTFDIVKATQYGAFDRIQHLILEENVDVNARDPENVTLLHWAAINNRLEICKFFLSKGAQVDAIGGELRSTPLHWATRQGKLIGFEVPFIFLH